MENGHFTGQILSGNKAIALSGEIRGNALSVEIRGAFNRRGTWDAPGNSRCSAEGSTRPATGNVTLPLLAACGDVPIHVTLYLDLPAAVAS